MKELSFLVVMVEAFFVEGFSRGNPLPIANPYI
jgi:hypothetical protein